MVSLEMQAYYFFIPQQIVLKNLQRPTKVIVQLGMPLSNAPLSLTIGLN